MPFMDKTVGIGGLVVPLWTAIAASLGVMVLLCVTLVYCCARNAKHGSMVRTHPTPPPRVFAQAPRGCANAARAAPRAARAFLGAQ